MEATQEKSEPREKSIDFPKKSAENPVISKFTDVFLSCNHFALNYFHFYWFTGLGRDLDKQQQQLQNLLFSGKTTAGYYRVSENLNITFFSIIQWDLKKLQQSWSVFWRFYFLGTWLDTKCRKSSRYLTKISDLIEITILQFRFEHFLKLWRETLWKCRVQRTNFFFRNQFPIFPSFLKPCSTFIVIIILLCTYEYGGKKNGYKTAIHRRELSRLINRWKRFD